MKDLGKRIAIVGVSAAGKSTFARELVKHIQLPLTHVDAVMWRPGWNYIGDEKTVSHLKEISLSPEWIIEGYIDKDAFDPVLVCADTIIYLKYPAYIAAWRYIKRWWRHRRTPRPELEGSPEKFSFEFLLRVWKKKEVYWLERFLGKLPNPEKVLILCTPKGAKRFLQSL